MRDWLIGVWRKLRGDRAALRELRAELADVQHRLALAIEAQEKATEQLIVERSLREAAEQRADRYHEELTDALKRSADWSARRISGKPMFGTSDPSYDAAASDRKPVEIPSKPFARSKAVQATNETLQALLKDIREEEMEQVGPEFGT